MDHCIECGHSLDAHVPDNDGYVCTTPYFDPVTDAVTFCTCSRTCCLEECCPKHPLFQGHATGWGGNPAAAHVCWCCDGD